MCFTLLTKFHLVAMRFENYIFHMLSIFIYAQLHAVTITVNENGQLMNEVIYQSSLPLNGMYSTM